MVRRKIGWKGAETPVSIPIPNFQPPTGLHIRALGSTAGRAAVSVGIKQDEWGQKATRPGASQVWVAHPFPVPSADASLAVSAHPPLPI